MDLEDDKTKFHCVVNPVSIGRDDAARNLQVVDQAVAPAVKLARDGFPLPRTVALSLSERYALLSRFSTTADVYLNNGSPLSPGSHFVQSEYARTLERLGRVGASELYGGETGACIAEDVEQNGGYLRLSDFEQYQPIVRDQVLSGAYRGMEISAVTLCHINMGSVRTWVASRNWSPLFQDLTCLLKKMYLP